MLVRFTDALRNLPLFLRADIVLGIHKKPGSLTETILMTNILTAQGPVTFTILEAPQEAADAVNRALSSGKSLITH